MYDFQDESTRRSLLSQMLNDQGARLIDEGEYREAIDILIKALKLYEQDNEKEGDDQPASSNSSSSSNNSSGNSSSNSKSIHKPSDNIPKTRRRNSLSEGPHDETCTCNCHHCRLETCFSRSVKISTSSATGSRTSIPNIDSGGNFIFQHPVYCAPTFSHEKHYPPGAKLRVIIVFNLALSYHLMSISSLTMSSSSRPPQPPPPLSTPSTTCDHTILRLSKKALQFYELFYKFQTERDVFSTQAMLAVANNVSEIYRVIGDRSRYNICLQHLTSCLVLVSEDIRVQQQQQQQQPIESSSQSIPPVVESTFEATESDTTIVNDHQHQYQRVQLTINSKEMKGYWKNASKLILRDTCAGTA